MAENKGVVVQNILKELILADPTLTDRALANKTGASIRSVAYARAKLRAEGMIEPARRGPNKVEKTLSSLPMNSDPEILSPDDLGLLAKSENLDQDLISDSEVRAKIIKSVQRMALDAKLHPDTRLSASQIWVKLKDVAKTTELGPGTPKTEIEIIDRLIRIFEAVGHTTVLKALELYTEKELSNENTPVEPTPAVEGTTEDIS